MSCLPVLCVSWQVAHRAVALTAAGQGVSRSAKEKEALIRADARVYNELRGDERAICYGDGANLLYPFQNDGTWTQAMAGNDDGSVGPISLGFTFQFYGDSYTNCWINNNGNLSFTGAYSVYTPVGFPSSQYVMVAPFWADVDTRAHDEGTGLVWYKFVGNNTFVVTWDNVGYYSQHVDRLNTFQVAISDGTNPDLGFGNNICFSYDNMCWTTGDVDGSGGFGGEGATAGCNRGNGVDFFQVGRFNHEGTDYDGPFGNPDGVSYLDGQVICLNAAVENIPPIPVDFPPGNEVTVSVPDVLDLTVGFLSPEDGQTTTVTIDDLNGAQAAGLEVTNTPGNPATVVLHWTPECCVQGTYQLVFHAQDDFDPPGVTNISLQIDVLCSNHLPVCNAGGPYVAECSGPLTAVTLDGTQSYDPDGGDLTYTWSTPCEGASFDDVHSPGPVLTIPSQPGCDLTCSVTLEVSDGTCPATCTTSVEVRDTLAPQVQPPPDLIVDAPPGQCSATVEVGTATGTDACAPAPAIAGFRSDQQALDAPYPLGDTTITWQASDECNHSSTDVQLVTVIPHLPDLQVLDLVVPAEGLTGQLFEVRWTVQNAGEAAATGPWIDRVLYTLDPNYPGGNPEPLGDTQFEGSLEAGDSYERIQQYHLPSQPGDYWIVVVADAQNSVCEGEHENNNFLVSDHPIHVEPTPMADLIVSAIDPPPDGVLSGTTTTIGYTVTNNGTAATEVTHWNDLVFIAIQDNIEWDGIDHNDQIFCNLDAPSVAVPNPQYLQPGESYSQTVEYTLPEDQIGDWYVYVLADRATGCHPGWLVPESDKFNNILHTTNPFHIDLAPQPDLVVSSISASPNPVFSGQELTVHWTDLNQGVAPTDSGQWEDRVYLSPNADLVIGPDDQFLASFNRSGEPLAGGQDDPTPTATGRIPVDSQGQFYVKVLADATNLISEFGAESNNVGVSADTVQVVLSVSVDLLPTEITGPATPVIPAHTFDITWSAENICAEPQSSMSWTDRVFLSAQETFDPNTAVVLGSFAQSTSTDEQGQPTLPPYTKTRTVRLPNDTAAGPHWLIVAVDADNAVFEGGCPEGEANNILVGAQPIDVQLVPTDLTVEVNFDSKHQLPTSAAAAQLIKLSWRVTNSGEAATPVSAWHDRAYLSVDQTVSADDSLLANVPHNGVLEQGGSYVAEAQMPTPLLGPGPYYLLIQADNADEVYEQPPGETNNVVGAPFTITPDGSDLLVTNLIGPDTGQAGQPVHIEWEVQNQGTLPTNVGTWTDNVYLSPQPELRDDAVLLGSRSHGGVLGNGLSYTAAGDFLLPLEYSGLYQIIVQTDAGNAVFETNETNNTLASPILLSVTPLEPSNLIVTAVDGPAEGVSGQALSVTWTVANTGTGPTNAATWGDAVYLSLDQFLDAQDMYLGEWTHHGPLDPTQSYTETQPFNVPFGVNGLFFVLVKTDSHNQVAELDHEDDNVNLDPELTQITIPPPADLVADSVLPPADGILGESAHFVWYIRNAGDQPVNGSWQDSLYLSADDQWDIGDRRIGTFVRPAGPLNPGETTGVSADAPLPAVLPGAYYVIARTDVYNQVPETNELNNLGASLTTFNVSATPLTLGQPYNGDLAAGDDRYFVLATPADETIRITLDHSSPQAWTELYVKYGAVATPGDFDFAYAAPGEPDQTILVPNSQAGDYYILARATANAGGGYPTAFTLLAEVIPFGISGVTPPTVGTGQVTLALTGSRWDAQTSFKLRHVASGNELVASSVELVSAAAANAVFDLSGMLLGAYDVIAISGGGDEAALEGRLLVESAGPLTLTVEIPDGPAIRQGSTGRRHAIVRNTCNTDIAYATLSFMTWNVEGYQMSLPQFGGEPFIPAGGVSYNEVVVGPIPPGQTYDLQVDIATQTSYVYNEIGMTAQAQPYSHEEFREGPLVSQTGESLRNSMLQNIQQYGLSPEEFESLNELLNDPDQFSLLVQQGFDELDVLPKGGGRSVGSALLCALKHQLVVVVVHFICEAVHLGPYVCTAISVIEEIQVAYCCFIDPCAAVCFGFEKPPSCNQPPPPPPPPPCPGPQPGGNREGGGASGGGCAGSPKPGDPNIKFGMLGFGIEQFVAGTQLLTYRVYFENTPEATAPASEVRITDPLDPALNVGSFRVGNIHFGDTTIEVPDNRISYQTTVDLSATLGVLVEITAGVDAQNRQAFWIFRSIDPATGEPPESGLLGFLPPEDGTGRGQGWVEYTIQPGSTVPTGTVVYNQASIVFDYNEAILTEQVFNTIDADAPSSAVDPLPPTSPTTDIPLTWSGNDPTGGSGLSTFTIYARLDGGAYAPAITDTIQISGTLSGARGGGVYDFYSIAKDNVGNTEGAPTTPDATTIVAVQIPAAPELDDVTAYTVRVVGLGSANVGRIDHALFEETTGKYVGPDGWLTEQVSWLALDQWPGITIRGLQPTTDYHFKAKARAGSGEETDFGPTTTVTTTATLRGDMNCDGVIDLGDINPFVLYMSNFVLWQDTYPICPANVGDINDDGTYGQWSFDDINPFVALMVGK
jgi:subtilase family serine protease